MYKFSTWANISTRLPEPKKVKTMEEIRQEYNNNVALICKCGKCYCCQGMPPESKERVTIYNFT